MIQFDLSSGKRLTNVNANRPKQLSQILAGYPLLDLRGSLDKNISSIVYDSRQAAKGSLFLAMPGLRLDGTRFIAEAVNRGATAFITETSLGQVAESSLPGITAIRVENCRRVLAGISAQYFGHPSQQLNLIGITGTNGKTTVAYLLESIFHAFDSPTGVIGTINYRYGGQIFRAGMTTPESLDLNRMMAEMVSLGIPNCVMEVSSHSLILHRVRELDFTTAVFTNLSRDHLDFHDALEDYMLAKKSLFTDHGIAQRVVNIDDLLGREIWQEAPQGTLTTAIHDRASVMAENILLNEEGSRFDLKTPWGNLPIHSRLLGKHNIYNMLSAAAAALQQNVPLETVARGMESLNCIPGRLQCVDLGQDFTVAIDYAHTDDALANVLKTARTFIRNKIILVFGCGGDRDRGKRKEMGRVALQESDFAVITSDNPRSENPDRIIEDICRGIPPHAREGKDFTLIADRKKAIEHAIDKAQTGDLVLIAGKGHEDYQILKTQTIHFDDREVALAALRKRAQH